MAALCGPSNALQNLQKHTSADRSFQQDRFRAGGSSQQNFRTSTPQSGWVDNEFDAFSSGQLAPGLQSPQQLHQQQFGSPQLQQQPSWAMDFQNLNIGQHQHQHHQQQQNMMHQQLNQTPSWGLEFSQRMQMQPPQQQSYSPQTGFAASNYTPQFSGLGMEMGGMGMQQEPLQRTQGAQEFQFDESAFEQAFAEAAREVNAGPSFDQAFTPFEPAFDHPTPVVQDKGKEPEKESFIKDQDDLARTAGQLLDSVKSDTSTKFQNSNFLALMRRLRDHEVVVEGHKMVETNKN